MRTRNVVGAMAVAAATIAGAFLLAGGSAFADTAIPTPHSGNATTCSGGQFPAGLSGDILFEGGGDISVAAGSADVATDNQSLAVTINAGWTASGIVVKGGNGYNLYSGPFVGLITLTGLVPSINGGNQDPTISHWFVCGAQSTTNTPTTPAATTTPPATTTPGATTTPPDGTTPVPTTTRPGLPVTGTAIGGIVLLGAGLVGGGALLLVVRRRRSASEPPTA